MVRVIGISIVIQIVLGMVIVIVVVLVMVMVIGIAIGQRGAQGFFIPQASVDLVWRALQTLKFPLEDPNIKPQMGGRGA